MRVTYQLTERDFRDAFMAQRRSTFLRRWVWRIFYLLFLFIVCYAIFTAWKNVTRGGADVLHGLMPTLALIFAWVVVLLGLPAYYARTQFRRQPSAQGEKLLSITPEGIVASTPIGKSNVSWEVYTRWFEAKQIFMLYSSPMVFTVVPKRAFTPEQLTEFRALLQANIGRK